MSPAKEAIASCPACGETNRADANFCRACGVAVARHANAYMWVSRIATAFALVSLATVVAAGGVAVGDPYSAEEAGVTVIVAGIIWFLSMLLAFTFGGWSAAGLRARRSWGAVIIGVLSRLMVCAILMILGGMAMEYRYYYRSYQNASDAARGYRQQLEESGIKPKGYWYY